MHRLFNIKCAIYYLHSKNHVLRSASNTDTQSLAPKKPLLLLPVRPRGTKSENTAMPVWVLCRSWQHSGSWGHGQAGSCCLGPSPWSPSSPKHFQHMQAHACWHESGNHSSKKIHLKSNCPQTPYRDCASSRPKQCVVSPQNQQQMSIKWFKRGWMSKSAKSLDHKQDGLFHTHV